MPFIIDQLAMSNDNEIHSSLTNGGPSHFEMDEAFCARMRAAIAAGLESAPIGVVTKPGTKNPKYVPAEQPVAFSGLDLV
jgi:hypothetical protein